MVTTTIYLDARGKSADVPANVKIVITKDRVRALISTGVTVPATKWDASRQRVIDHPGAAALNHIIQQTKAQIDSILFNLEASGSLPQKASEIKNLVLDTLHPKKDTPPIFIERAIPFADRHSDGSRTLYYATFKKMQAFTGDRLDSLQFDQITYDWLCRFDKFLSTTSPSRNARNIHFRNIRAVFNDAITDEVITCYPFRKFKTTPERTRKRAIPIDRLRALFSLDVAPHERRYLDCFKLIFFLCGINIIDLCHLDQPVNGRIEYDRAKTHRPYSIKIEPEAEAIIDDYRGEFQLLNYLDSCTHYRSFYSHLNSALKAIGRRVGIDGLSTYYARHSWATIASYLDIPKETIAAGLGHGGNSVTDIYIDFDIKKVDRANRRIIDFILYGRE